MVENLILKSQNVFRTVAGLCSLRLLVLHTKKTEGVLTLVPVSVDCLLGLNCPLVWQFEENTGLGLWQLLPPRATVWFPAAFGGGVQGDGVSWELDPKIPHNLHSSEISPLSVWAEATWLENERNTSHHQTPPIPPADHRPMRSAGITVAQAILSKLSRAKG